MRIEGSDRSSSKDISKSSKGSAKISKTKRVGHRRIEKVSKTFKNLVLSNSKEYSEEILKQFLEEAVNAGNEFVKMPTMANLKLYKNRVEKYMEYVVDKLYIYDEEISRDKKKLYRVMNKINDYVHSLTKMLLDNEKSTIAYMAKVDEIRGLLMDIYK
jgi:hypothetical protein